jgi:glucose/arabinose dehydrogenase
MVALTKEIKLRYLLHALLITVFTCTNAVWAQSGLDDIVLPDGFSIDIYSDEVPKARSMALGDNGTVFVGTRKDSKVYALIPQDSGGARVVTVARNLKAPNGVAFHDGALYIAETTRITRYDDIENSLDNIPEPAIVNDTIPGASHHNWRYIAFGPDNKLYISIGAPCNICDRKGFANISRLNADGTGLEVFAEGIRNSVGFTWHPRTGDFWFTDNGRDMLGDDTPPGELNLAAQAGMHFGFPYCHGGDVKDPEFGEQRSCGEFTAPAQKLGAHVAPLGVKFYTGEMFPPEYRGQIFIAEHGSWNRSKKIGYRISLVRLEGSEAQSYETFAEGWLQGDDVSGRPVDLLILDDGSLLVSDDKAGRIYRISYANPLTEGIVSDNNGR